MNLADMQLQAEDVLLLQGAREQLEVLTETADFTPLNFTPAVDLERLYHLQDRFVLLRIPPDSALVEHTLAESRLGDAYGLTVVGISRAGETELMPRSRHQSGPQRYAAGQRHTGRTGHFARPAKPDH
jgi:uncharacterized protein with PhoU and TrkA domain